MVVESKSHDLVIFVQPVIKSQNMAISFSILRIMPTGTYNEKLKF